MAKKIKIGIITLPLSNYNYGGILQAYALQRYVRSLGFEVEYLDRQYDVAPVVKFKMKLHTLLNYGAHKKANDKVFNFNRFLKNRIQKSKAIHSSEALSRYATSKNFDFFITGSDQVWRRDYANTIYKDLYLGFTDKPKISYAASFGKNKLSEIENEEELAALLKKFKAVSVREKSGVEICERLGIQDVHHHVDPTMLLSKEEYLQLLENDRPKNSDKRYLLSYILDDSEEKRRMIDKIAAEKGLVVVKNGKNAVDAKDIEERYISIEDWIARFSMADYVITDSFHGSVFSILFNIPFVSLGNKERGLSRFNSLLEMFSLKDRLSVQQDYDSVCEVASRPMNFDAANEQLEFERQKAEKYFTDHLKK